MTKNSLQTWYHNNQINYSEKERLNKIGVNDYDYYNLQDLKQILLCEEWAKSNSEIRNNVGGWIIKKIIFFTPNFNDSKPDASNYSCAIITVAGYLWKHNWVIIYRPSYVSTIESDVFIKKLDISVSETENKLNGDYPILATVSSEGTEFILSYSLIDKPFVRKYNLPYDAKNNPDKYILSLDIVKRESDIGYHFAIYLGGEKVVHLPGEKLAQFDSWYRFCNPSSSSGSSSSSSSFWSSSSSSNSSSSSKNITTYHPLIPFKRKTDIIHHVAKIIGHGYGGCSCHPYNVVSNNCEHLVKRCIFNLDNSLQVETYTGALSINIMDKAIEVMLTPLGRMENQSNRLDNLTCNYYQCKWIEDNYIELDIWRAENNRFYTRSKYQIEQEKFQERIEVYPKDSCKVQ